jgi:flagellar motility protein MotE (MotC chaperone)
MMAKIIRNDCETIEDAADKKIARLENADAKLLRLINKLDKLADEYDGKDRKKIAAALKWLDKTSGITRKLVGFRTR